MAWFNSTSVFLSFLYRWKSQQDKGLAETLIIHKRIFHLVYVYIVIHRQCRSPRENEFAYEFLPYFSSRAQHVLFVILRWFARWEVSGCIAAVLWDSASRMYSDEHTISKNRFDRVFSSSISLNCIWFNCRVALIRLQRFPFYFIRSIRFPYFMRILTSLSADEILLPRHVNWSTNKFQTC